ncbi:hypothetical protein ACFOD3_03865 [Falsiroseomonas tokyonensis]|uniref:Uncharacterized protein n=2 Tax=Falsiroseomonas tokyonensis TaxID=430521 RepID=A0ABV7BQ50_9PROT|nr:hypothetical protein [Falsiroseomonas tokyonensis]
MVLFAFPAMAAPMAVRQADGSCALREVPEAVLAEWDERLGAEAARLQSMAHRLLADAAAMRLAAAREAVPAFGDWAYGWVQSYMTAYRVLGLAARGLAEGVAQADAQSLPERIAQGMATPVREEFRNRVLAPAIPPESLAEDRAHVAALVSAEWRRALEGVARQAAALPRVALIAPGAVSVPRLDLAAAARPLADWQEAGLDPLALVVEEGADTGTVFLRSMRPMAARLGAVVLRVSEAGSLVATGGAFGYALGGTPGVALGVAGGVGLSWGLDWVLNRVDSALNREAFEAQALEAIGRAETRLADEGRAAIAAALAARQAALRGAQTGCG